MCPPVLAALGIGSAASTAGAAVIAAESAGPLAILTSTGAGAAAAGGSTFLGMTSAQLAAASLATSVLGAGAQIAGQFQAGKAAQGQAAFQAAVARNNSILAERAAQDAIDRGNIQEQLAAGGAARLRGRQRAVLAANGVLVDEGSALDITSDTAAKGKFDQLTIRSNAEREALGFRSQGLNFQNDASLALLRGESAQAASTTGAFTTALTSAGSVARDWYLFRKEQ